MNSSKYHACLFLLIIFLGFACPVQARVVTVVYDDSKSMFGGFTLNIKNKKIHANPTDRWVYANYALQTLAALMHKEDKLYVVRMNAFNEVSESEEKSAKVVKYLGTEVSKALRDIMSYGCGKTTPYGSVSFAVDCFLNATDKMNNHGKFNDNQLRRVKEKRKDWLIIITDGSFDGMSDGSAKAKAEDIEKYKEKAGKDSRVIFLLIGAKPDESLYSKWRQSVGGHVEELITVQAAEGGKDILDAMKKVAAIIEGRDAGEDKFRPNFCGDTFDFESPYPLRRVSVQQQIEGIKNFSTPSILRLPDGSETPFSHFEVESPHKTEITTLFGQKLDNREARDITGIISTAGSNEKVMGAGIYQIYCPGNFTDYTVKNLLIETSINFQPVLEVKGVGIKEENENNSGYDLCRDDEIRLHVKFSDYKSNQTLNFNEDQAGKIDVHVLDSDMKKIGESFAYDNRASEFISNWQKVSAIKGPLDLKEISIRAVSHGYFDLKSDVFKIKAEKRSRNVTATLYPSTVNVLYKFCDTPKEVASVSVNLSNVQDKSRVKLTARDIPKGITISSQEDSDSTGYSAETAYSIGSPVTVYLYRDKHFNLPAPAEFYLEIQFPDDPALRISNVNTKVKILPQKRNIEFVPDRAIWNGSVVATQNVPPFILRLSENGKFIDLNKENWDVSTHSDCEAGFQLSHNPELNGDYAVTPDFGSLVPPLPASAGEFPVQINWQGPFPGETFSSTIVLSMMDSDLLTKYRWLAGLILFFFCMVWFIWRLLTKRRFTRDAKIKFKTTRSDVPPRVQTIFLRKKGVSVFLSRWLWPSTAEKINVRGVNFKAGDNSASIVIARHSQKRTMYMHGVPLDSPGHKDQGLPRGSALEDRGDYVIKEYYYE
ncbi:hypothetical protein [Desulfovibrio gilichinskyi]|uniref:von Willebrand factor type A domain-containing protein n=1 Tax=Desulfovibrio gilichinskyi TaxID=1519643 RepID=A0A1X7DLR8_9BACT|nr:hypothetical protein [Desulfovibrio gilichinskyi]SMF17808.1 hypothetical protein SAMN06295933_2044 [Desulfovibrio gilichinskyi]